MSRRKLFSSVIFTWLLAAVAIAHGQVRISEDRDLLEIDLTGWECLDRPEGTAKSEDGADRNRGKNRPPIDLAGLNIPTRRPDSCGTSAHLIRKRRASAARI